MPWQKSSPELIARFDAALPPDPKVERRRMFGCACAFVNGRMFTGLHEQNIIVRLPERRRLALIEAGRAVPFTVMGRTLREYVAIVDAVHQPLARLRTWIGDACAFASTPPPKQAPRARGRAGGKNRGRRSTRRSAPSKR
jgi:TfoX/Sxy family transcriptional regulator of competence genes